MGEVAARDQLAADGGEHSVEVSVDLVVPEPNDLPAMSFEPRSTACIVGFRIRTKTTVNLDNQLGPKTNEIGDKRLERQLPTEPRPIQLPHAQCARHRS